MSNILTVNITNNTLTVLEDIPVNLNVINNNIGIVTVGDQGPSGPSGIQGIQGPPGDSVNPDWNATSGLAEILNKPSLNFDPAGSAVTAQSNAESYANSVALLNSIIFG
jgi:hypothetical protein